MNSITQKITKLIACLALTMSVYSVTPVFAEESPVPSATTETTEVTATPTATATATTEATATPTVTPTETTTATPTPTITPVVAAAPTTPVVAPVLFGLPRAGLVETNINSTKTSTNISGNQYQVTFSFPGEQSTTTPEVDVMIVMDKSSIEGTLMDAFKVALNNMIDTLAANTGVHYKVGFVWFNAKVHDETNGLLDLSVPANVTRIKDKITHAGGGGGTTLIGGVEVGKKYLDADTSVPAENKFLVLTTDFGGYLEYSDSYQADSGAGIYYMYGYDETTMTAASEGNGDIASHRSGCTDITSADIANLVDNGVLLTRQPVANMSWLSDGGDDSSFSYLGGTDIQAKYDAGKNIIPRSSLGLPTTPIGWEHTIYRVGKMLQDMDNSGYHLEAITTLYHPEQAYTNSISQAIGDWFGDSFGNRFDVSAGGTAAVDAVDSITADIQFLVQKATLYDTVNTANFSLDATSFEVTLGGVTLPKTDLGGGNYGFGTFGTPVVGAYPYDLFTDGTNIEFYINDKVSVDNQLQLKFIEELDPTTLTNGIVNSISTNTDAHLEFMNTAEFNADPNTYTMKHTYSNPTVAIDLTNPVTPPSHDETFLVTFLDCNGNTVKIEWVPYGGSASAPSGFGNYSGYTNVTSHRDLTPSDCSVQNKWRVPGTGVE